MQERIAARLGASSTHPPIHSSIHAEGDVLFAANAVRLSPREWLVALVLVAAVFIALPIVWERAETFEPADDYRVAYEHSNDYWLFRRLCRRVAAKDRIPVVGDSVIWGRYVDRRHTLAGQLNALGGAPRFATLAVNGMHPASLAGLLDHYGAAVAGRAVVLHVNLLWMSSKRHDLRETKEFRFNHPDLVPQFVPRIPCYRADHSQRLAAVVERTLPLAAWARHIRVAHFGESDLPNWTLDHPYGSPLARIRLAVPPAAPRSVSDQRPWTERGIRKQSFPWVDLRDSLQWRFVRDALATLERRGNRVFVLLGPFNEHLLQPNSLAAYQGSKSHVVAWLEQHGIPHLVPPPLPSHLCADASHPVADGYALLARQLLGTPAFVRFTSGSRSAE